MTESEARAEIVDAKRRLLFGVPVKWVPQEWAWVSQSSEKVFSLDWMRETTEEGIAKAVADDAADWVFWYPGVPSPVAQERIKAAAK